MPPSDITRLLVDRQRDEITEYHIYNELAQRASAPNREVLQRLADMEKRHYEQWAAISGNHVAPNWWKVRLYRFLAHVFGLTFMLRLMERGEEKAQEAYRRLAEHFPEARAILEEEMEHEDTLLGMLDEQRLEYLSSIVLGLNDALVELTGALAGLTLALRHPPLIALSGTITGVAAAMSMAASEYLSTKAEKETARHPIWAALYTGLSYLAVVLLLVLPFLVLSQPFLSLAISLSLSAGIIALFSYYRAVVYTESFLQNFLEMLLISFGVAAISFGLGYLLRLWFGIEV